MSPPSNRDEPVTSTKSFEISKHAVLAANRRVKANRDAAGVSGLGFTFKPRRLTPATIEQLSARYNKVQGGWWNDYGNFCPSVMRKLAPLTPRRQKRLAGHLQQSALWLQRVVHHRRRLFIHWQPLSSPIPVAGIV